MATSKSVVITGIPEIDRRLKTLEPRLQRKVLRQSMRDGLKLLKAAVEREAPVDTGATKAAVKVRAVKARKRGSIELEVRIAADEKLKKESANGKTYFYPAIVEYTHDAFMERAFDSDGEMARQRTIAGIRSGTEREASSK